MPGLWDPNNNRRIAGYIFNEFKFCDSTKAQIAGRIEHVNLDGTTPTFPAISSDAGAIAPSAARDLKFTPKSVSVGLIQNLPWDLVAQRHGATRRARAEARRTVLARRP